MQGRLRKLPLRRQLTLVTMITTAFALALGCGLIALLDQITRRRDLVDHLASAAELVGYNSVAAISFEDPASAEQTLRSLSTQQNILAAAIYRRDGRLFAAYHRPGTDARPFPARAPRAGQQFDADSVEIRRPIFFAGENNGTIYLRSDLADIRQRLGLTALVFAGVVLVTSVIAFFIINRLQRVVSGPIAELAGIARRVAEDRDYTLRAERRSDDEVGALIDGFNHMLAQIQTRDASLQKAHDELEQRVADRTRELEEEIGERQRSEQAVRESHLRFEIVTSATADVIWDRDMQTGVVWRNDNFQRLFGYPAGVIDSSEAGWAGCVHPDDLPETMAVLAATFKGKADHWTASYRFRRADGTYAFVLDRGHILRNAEGRPVRVIGAMQDVTALKQAEQEAAREKARLQLIFESVPVGICLDHVTERGAARDRIINRAHLDICGLTRDTAFVGAFSQLTHPDDRPRQAVLRAQLDQGLIRKFSLEKRYVRGDGQVVWVAYTVQRNWLSDGSYEDLSTIVDITELKQAQEDVAHERARFKFIFDSVPVGISCKVPSDPASHLVNPAHERITGVSAADSKLPGAFARVSHPDDYARQQALVARYLRGEIDHYTLEKRYLHPDGRVVWAVLTSRMFTDPVTGEKQSMSTLADITELKRAQEQSAREQARFKFIFDAVPIGFTWMMLGNAQTRIVNPAYARITGVPLEACRDLERYRQVTHPEDQARQHAMHLRLLAGEIDHYEIEKRYLLPDGTVNWAALAVRSYRDATTGERQEISTLIDLTERKRTEAALAETNRRLLETSRQAGMAEVATGVLHNVGNVLNSVNVSTTLLSDLVRQSKGDRVTKLAELFREQEHDLAQFFTHDSRSRQIPTFLASLATHLGSERTNLLKELESLRKNIEHIKDIVAMQQSYAKVSGVSEAVPVADLIEDAVRMNQGAFARHEVTLVRDFQAQPIVTVEKHKVLQILVNLMRNAKYACEESGQPQKLMTVRVTAADGRVRIAIIDNGVGIPPENLTRIFAHGFTTRRNGHGFGLHSGALAARELGGALTAHSAGRGHGATFVLELPYRPDGTAS